VHGRGSARCHDEENRRQPVTVKDANEATDTDRSAFSRGKDISGKGLPKLKVKSIVGAIHAKWKNAPEVIIADDMDEAAIPQEVKDENARQLAQGAKGAPGAFIPGAKVYIIASLMNSAKDVIEALFHESLGTMGCVTCMATRYIPSSSKLRH